VASAADVTRTHIEDYKPWSAVRPGQKVARLKPATIAGHLGRLRMFFIPDPGMGLGPGPVQGPDRGRRPAPPGPPPAQSPG
jgi:hypothetical protein